MGCRSGRDGEIEAEAIVRIVAALHGGEPVESFVPEGKTYQLGRFINGSGVSVPGARQRPAAYLTAQ